MSTPSCAPPDSLIQWATSLVVGAILLVIAALALAQLRPGRWRSRGFGALSLLGALASVGLTGWSLTLAARIQALYATLTARDQADPFYCVFGGGHAPPGFFPGWQRQTAALIDPLQHQALITICATFAFLLVAVAFCATFHRVGRERSRWTLDTSVAAADEHALDALTASAPLLGLAWSRRRRLIAGAVAALLLATGLGAFMETQYVRASESPPDCATGLSAADDQQIRSMGIALLPAQTPPAPVNARAAIAASEQALGDARPAQITCVVTKLALVDSSSVVDVPRFVLVWVVGFRIPGMAPGPDRQATPPSVEWTFVDAQSGDYLYGAWMSSVGG